MCLLLFIALNCLSWSINTLLEFFLLPLTSYFSISTPSRHVDLLEFGLLNLGIELFFDSIVPFSHYLIRSRFGLVELLYLILLISCWFRPQLVHFSLPGLIYALYYGVWLSFYHWFFSKLHLFLYSFQFFNNIIFHFLLLKFISLPGLNPLLIKFINDIHLLTMLLLFQPLSPIC